MASHHRHSPAFVRRWQVAILSFFFFCLAAAPSSAQTLTASNTTDPRMGWVTLDYDHATNNGPVASIIPLTPNAHAQVTEGPVTGQLILTTASNFGQLAKGQVAYIDCEESDYPGNLNAINTTQGAEARGVSAVIFYSTRSAMCDYTPADNEMQMLYSMASTDDSKSVLSDIGAAHSTGPLQAQIAATAPNGTASPTTIPSSAPTGSTAFGGGGGPSTAVAMVILYSITGVITSLFLIIIITGAIRAHRHPERYGPRMVLGRPAQSRAKGIARAMLDTLPIVKFGQNDPPAAEEPKPEELEMGRVANEENGEGTSAAPQAERAANATATGEDGVEHDESAREHKTEEGAAAAAAVGTAAGAAVAEGEEGEPKASSNEKQKEKEKEKEEDPAATEAAVAEGSSSAAAAAIPRSTAASPPPTGIPDDSLSCSICTEDFERGEDVRVLPCNHHYHPACIDPWLLNISGTCPLCRIDLRPQNGENGESSGAAGEEGLDSFPPPLNEPGNDVATEHQQNTANGARESRRLSFLRDVLRSSTLQERRAAVERLRDRDARRNQGNSSPAVSSGALGGMGNATTITGAGGDNPPDLEEFQQRRSTVTWRLRENLGVATRRASQMMVPARDRSIAREMREMELVEALMQLEAMERIAPRRRRSTAGPGAAPGASGTTDATATAAGSSSNAAPAPAAPPTPNRRTSWTLSALGRRGNRNSAVDTTTSTPAAAAAPVTATPTTTTATAPATTTPAAASAPPTRSTVATPEPTAAAPVTSDSPTTTSTTTPTAAHPTTATTATPATEVPAIDTAPATAAPLETIRSAGSETSFKSAKATAEETKSPVAETSGASVAVESKSEVKSEEKVEEEEKSEQKKEGE